MHSKQSSFQPEQASHATGGDLWLQSDPDHGAMHPMPRWASRRGLEPSARLRELGYGSIFAIRLHNLPYKVTVHISAIMIAAHKMVSLTAAPPRLSLT